jgi:hypothetical protein
MAKAGVMKVVFEVWNGIEEEEEEIGEKDVVCFKRSGLVSSCANQGPSQQEGSRRRKAKDALPAR